MKDGQTEVRNPKAEGRPAALAPQRGEKQSEIQQKPG
jgi:hypothetical protein